MTYSFSLRAATGLAYWQLPTEFVPSYSTDEGALAYARRQMVLLSGCSSILGIDVWKNGEGLAFVSMEKPQAKVELL